MQQVAMIAFNVGLMAVVACLFKPGLLTRYTGGEPLSRWVFVVALVVLVAISPYGPSQRQMQAKKTVSCEHGVNSAGDCIASRQSDEEQQGVPMMAPAAADVTEAAAVVR